MSLVGEWEIGLKDIFLPKTLHNVKEGEIWVKCFADREYTFHVPSGSYPTVFSLVPTIHLLFRSAPHLAIAMNFDHITSRGAFVISRGREIQMSPRLANLLGFETSRLQPGWHACPRSVDLDENILFVYCDLVQDRFNGETLAPLLAFVNTRGRFGAVIHKYYDRIRYHKMQKKIFQTVTIYIKDVNDRPVSFNNGCLLVNLHLRKV